MDWVIRFVILFFGRMSSTCFHRGEIIGLSVVINYAVFFFGDWGAWKSLHGKKFFLQQRKIAVIYYLENSRVRSMIFNISRRIIEERFPKYKHSSLVGKLVAEEEMKLLLFRRTRGKLSFPSVVEDACLEGKRRSSIFYWRGDRGGLGIINRIKIESLLVVVI